MQRDLIGKNITILGFGLEGAAAAEFLIDRGAKITIFEQKGQTNLDEGYTNTVERLLEKGVQFHFGATESSEAVPMDFLVRSPGVPLSHPLVKTAQNKGVPITSGTALFFEECPAPIIGVTGTKGKGTTSSLIYTMLREAGRKARLVGNIGEPALKILSEVTADEVIVYELSSFQLLEVSKSPHLAIVLMVTQDHLDFHGSVSEYAKAKANIVRYQTEGDMVVANIDYDGSRRIAESSSAKKFWVSRRRSVAEGCFIEDGMIVVARDGTREVIASTQSVALPGAHNLENVCAAVMAGLLFELPVEVIRTALQEFRGLPHRLQLVGEKNAVRYYDDSISTTPESTIAAIESFDAPKILILGGSSKGADFAELAKNIVNSNSILAIIGIGEEWPRIREELRKQEVKIRFIEGCSTMKEIVATAREIARPGDVILLSPGCASFGMFESYKDRGEQFVKAVSNL
jgi:UDP-N-acetylmuramoylalanine--D-glutamate ligase